MAERLSDERLRELGEQMDSPFGWNDDRRAIGELQEARAAIRESLPWFSDGYEPANIKAAVAWQHCRDKLRALLPEEACEWASDSSGA